MLTIRSVGDGFHVQHRRCAPPWFFGLGQRQMPRPVGDPLGERSSSTLRKFADHARRHLPLREPRPSTVRTRRRGRCAPARSRRQASGRTAAPGCSGRRSSPARTRAACRPAFVRAGPTSGKGGEAGSRAFARATVLAVSRQAVGLVVGAALRHGHLHLPIALEVHHRALGRVDRDLVEVGGAQAALLGVEVAEQAPLQQRIVGKVDARHDVGRAIGHLLGLGEEVVRIAVQHHPADQADGDDLLRNDLGRIEHVIGLGVGEFLVEGLDAQLPLGKIAPADGLEQVAAVDSHCRPPAA